MYVLDASVILKWFVEENNTPEAIAIKKAHIRGEYSLVMPDIAIYEVANALRYNPVFNSDNMNICCNNLCNLNISIITPAPSLVNLATEKPAICPIFCF